MANLVTATSDWAGFSAWRSQFMPRLRHSGTALRAAARLLLSAAAVWDCFRGQPGYAPRAFGTAMQSGNRPPKVFPRLQLLLLRAVVCCALGWLWLLPSVASAATSIPMCSNYSECAEAPWPESPPTGGEMRAPMRSLFDWTPTLDRAPSKDSSPIHWQLTSVEPLALAVADMLPQSCGYAVEGFGASELTPFRTGVRREVFRPPCVMRRA